MTAPQPEFGTHRYGPLTDAAQALLGGETARRDEKTARLKEARLAKAIEIEPEKPKRKPGWGVTTV
jgi:hypothetical protein